MTALYLVSWLIAIPYFWMIVIAIKNDHYIWGIFIFLFCIPSFLYGIIYWDKAKGPFIMGVALFVLWVSVIWTNIDEIAEYGRQEELRLNPQQNSNVESNSSLSEWVD